MCGVVAAWTRTPLHRDQREAALRALAHRGPDGSGELVTEEERVWLGHTRLAIIAPEDGRQPLTNEDGKVHAVVGGEIYEYEEMRRRLETLGHRFATRSDSEVLLHLYEERGLAFVSELRGELAFVLFDERRKLLVAGRDRFGIKPLSYASNDDGLFLASEAKALFAMGVEAAWDTEAFVAACTHQYLPAQRTLFHGIKQVPPGHLLVKEGSGAPRLERYWDLDLPLRGVEERATDPDVGPKVRALLDEAVGLRLRADVPVAFALSGGLDSTLVTALATQRTGRPVQTFGVTFDHPPYDERDAALAAAAHLGAVHHPVEVGQDDLIDALPDAVAHGEGLAINGQLPAKLLLARAIRAAGFSVVLTGEGADELFYGYSHLLADLAGTLPVADAAVLRRRLATGHGASRGVMLPREGGALDPLLSPLAVQLGSVPAFLKAKVAFGRRLWSLLEPDAAMDLEASSPLGALLDAYDVGGQLAGRHPVAQSAYLWTRLALAGYILKTLGDGTEMAASVEGRPPFLDHHLAEAARDLPLASKIRGGVEKHVLREAARGLVPESTRVRPKHPFLAPPLTLHTTTRGRALVRDLLSSAAIEDVPFVDRKRVMAFLDGLDTATEEMRHDAEPVLFLLLSACLLGKRFGLRRLR
jgi:asparagine synthase (glutamine-hydrolysing)